MVNQDLVHRDIITPLKSSKFDGNLALALDTVFTVSNDMHAALNKILSGGIGLFYGTSKKVFLIEMRDWQHRQIEEPTSESVIRGPKEGFVENIRTNTAMVRRKIKTPDLRLDDFSVGRQTRTTVTLVYIQGIVNIEVLEELKKRISDIDTDMILETGQIEQLICKNNYSPVSGIGLTQKPDKLAQKILEGRVAVLVDGTPHALIVPELFTESLHSTSDYYNRTLYVNAIRILRSIGLLITILLPGISIAVFTYNQEMLPSVFLTTIISLTLKTPMPFAVEVLVMTVMFELVKEAGTRLPKAVGSAVTIVGSLIIGDEAVRAGLVSAPSIIVVAVTAIASFMLPRMNSH